jgi:UDP-N-acetylmuramoyl-L-alanyl-D-glutamate--2,6-diaminopimelate ligase
MKLNQLLKNVEVVAVKGNTLLEIDSISSDSKQLKNNGLFFAIKGYKANGIDFVDEAIERGAVCVVSEDDFITYKNVCKIIVKDARKSCAIISNNFYDNPSQKVHVTGITGTNGKTTILYLAEQILQYSGKKCGKIGTISYDIGERKIPAENTTPSSITLQMFLNEMTKLGFSHCVMEVSSHSLHQHRVNGIRYKCAIFTNLTGEHLDYHKDMDGYFKAKKMLFEGLSEDACAITNMDDGYGRRLREETKARLLSYGINNEADIMAFDIKSSTRGSQFKVKTPQGEIALRTPLIGGYNISNILACVAFAVSQAIDFKYVQEAVAHFKGAPGRLQRIEHECNFSVFVDYAHTDDALRNVLSALKNIAKAKIIVVFGCGGDRDKTKRPRMAHVAAELADFVVVTSDNPRSEDPEIIIDETVKGFPAGFKNYKRSIDREKAIRIALDMASDDDIVLIAGKGHEKYQIFKDQTIDFDDCKVCEDILAPAKTAKKA